MVELLAGAALRRGMRCAVAVQVTFIGGQPLEPSAGLAIPQKVLPWRAGAREAAGSVDALVGTGLREPLALIYVCPQYKERPAPGKGEAKVIKKRKIKVREKGEIKGIIKGMQAMKTEEKDEGEGMRKGIS